MGGSCSTYRKHEKFLNVLIRKPEGKRPLVRSRRRYEGKLKKEDVCVDWIHLTHGRDQ